MDQPQALKQAGKFALVGILNTLIDYIILNALVWLSFTASLVILGQKFLIANFISVGAAMINSFILNRQWTFESRGEGENVYLQIAKFLIVTILGVFVISQIVFGFFYYTFTYPVAIAISVVNLLGLSRFFSDGFIALNFAKSLSVVAGFIWNFLGYKFIVFRK